MAPKTVAINQDNETITMPCIQFKSFSVLKIIIRSVPIDMHIENPKIKSNIGFISLYIRPTQIGININKPMPIINLAR